MAKSDGFVAVPVGDALKEVGTRTAEIARTGVSRIQNNMQGWLRPRKRRRALKQVQERLGRLRKTVAVESTKVGERVRQEADRRGSRWQGALAERLSILIGSLAAGLGLLQVALERSMQRARGRLEQARGNLEEARSAWREERARRARRRRRARFIFRVGLVVGIVLALLFAPRPGVETRRRLAGYLRNVVAFFQSRPFSRAEQDSAEHVPLRVS
jgi:hypothetical protein